MIMTTAQPESKSTPSNLLPRASAGNGDLHPTPAQPSSSPSPAAPIINALLEDLFNPSISTLDLCNLHGLSLAKLADILESETFRAAREAFERINAARSSIIESEAKALATARLATAAWREMRSMCA